MMVISDSQPCENPYPDYDVFLQVKVNIKGKEHLRYFSPVSCPDDFGIIELVLRFETQGIMSQHFKALKPGGHQVT